MREVKRILDQHTRLHTTTQCQHPAASKGSKMGNKPLALHLHMPEGGLAKSAVTSPWTTGLSLMTLRLDMVYGCVLLAHKQFLKKYSD